MFRTWSVRLPASVFTFSVRSFQTPETPFTSAWPPSLPSVPTSRATRVTSSANEESWSTIVLIVFFSSAISPRTSTVTFFERSPFATAVVTSAMLRTCSVSDVAMKFTDSVRPRHVPLTPSTCAWPPSRPSVPTSRATRVTSSANEQSWSTIVLSVFFSSRISPRASTVIFCERSPRATAVATCAMLRTWLVRLSAIWFTFSVRPRHVPETPSTSAWPPRMPSVPTSRATRVTSSANVESWSTIVLSVFFSSRISPRASTVIFCVRSPFATAVATSAMLRTWSVRFDAMPFTDSVRSRHVPLTSSTSAWPPRRPSVPTSRATRVTSAANAESWSTIVLIVFLSSSTSPLHVDGDLLREVAVRDGGRDVGDVAHLLGERERHAVHRLGEAAPRAADAFDLRLAAELALGADLARDARDLGGERGELVDHRVDRVLQLGDLALDVDGDLLRQVAVRDGGRDLRDVAHLRRQVAGERVDVVGQVLPDAADALDVRLAAEAALGADLARDARHLGARTRAAGRPSC